MNEKIRIIELMFFLFFVYGLSVKAQEYNVDTSETLLTWEGKGIGKAHRGSISISSGLLTLKDGLPVSGKVAIDMNTITNTDIESEDSKARLIGHLKSDDFFSVESFPEVVFEVGEVHSGGDGKMHVNGNLTIKGITHPVEFMAEYSVKGNSATFKGIIEVDRSLYDVRYGSDKFFDNLGNKTINNIFTLHFQLNAVKSD